jgi:hypothetical protein
MSDLQTDLRRDINARLEALRPAVIESTRLEAARAALRSTDSTTRRQSSRSRPYPPSAGNSGPGEFRAPGRQERELPVRSTGFQARAGSPLRVEDALSPSVRLVVPSRRR